MRSFFLSLILVFTCVVGTAGGQSSEVSAKGGGLIIVGADAPQMEQYAAKELQRYIYQLSGTWLKVSSDLQEINQPSFIIGQPGTRSTLRELISAGSLKVSATDPGPQGYVLKKLTIEGRPMIVIAGSDGVGCLYGVYGLLADHYHIGFFLGGDVLPDKKSALTWPDVDERKVPAMYIRGFLPWTNFPQSATSYSWEDWKFIIDQMAKMRLNFLHIHNYNGELGHNEMYHNFTYKGFTSRVWMPTARSGHAWAGPGWDVNKYRFGATDLFDDYDFGADCALHNEALSNDQIFKKSSSLFQRVIEYAHSRGVRVGLGLDIDLIPPEYHVRADDPEVVAARVDQLASDYRDLDYVLCFQSENVGKNVEFYQTWRNIFNGFYEGIKARMPHTRVAVAGWGLDPRSIATLPQDVICAPIAYYSDKCESGAIYGDREYWGCPWLERDFNSSEYYYPYNLNLSSTIAAYRDHAPNMKGFYCLTWRLTDAIDPKIWYVSRAPWDNADQLSSSEIVYHQYATLSYGPEAAGEITEIINQNEPFACDFGECQATPGFTRDQMKYLLNISRFTLHGADASKMKEYAAASFSSQQGVQKAPCTEGGDCVGYINDGDWARFDSLDFGGQANVFEARVASASEGGVIELRLDSPAGPMLGKCIVSNTGDWQKWESVTVKITPTSGSHTLFMNFRLRTDVSSDHAKAVAQLATIDKWISRTNSSARRERLSILRCRIAAEKDHIELNENFTKYTWDDLPGAMESWAKNFTRRVTDISSLGNILSTQNRFVQLNYVARENALRKSQLVKAPSYVVARGTKEGAIITWKNEEPNAVGFNVYRDGKKLNRTSLQFLANLFTDKGNGIFQYTVTAVNSEGIESPYSVPSGCPAGKADRSPPRIVLISPPVSQPLGQSVSIKARILDDRAYESVSAALVYRRPSAPSWKRMPLARRVKAIFDVAIPAFELTADGIEYYVEASDGESNAVYPVSAPEMPLSLVTYEVRGEKPPSKPRRVEVQEGMLRWAPAEGNVFWYRIYRSSRPDFQPGPANFVTYLQGSTTSFRDEAEGFDGRTLKGRWYYRITAVDKWGNEGLPSQIVEVRYPK
jgi:hypothetical protein